MRSPRLLSVVNKIGQFEVDQNIFFFGEKINTLLFPRRNIRRINQVSEPQKGIDRAGEGGLLFILSLMPRAAIASETLNIHDGGNEGTRECAAAQWG